MRACRATNRSCTVPDFPALDRPSPCSCAHEKAPQCGAGCETGNRGCRPCGRRVSGQGKIKVPKAGGLRLDDKGMPPVGCYRRGAVVKASAAPAIALDRYRGWGRYPLARIRAQREPVVSPAGTGTEYRRPRRVSWRLARQGARKLFGVNGRTADQGNRVGRHSRTNCLLALRPHVPGRTRTPSQKGSRAWEAPQRAGRMPRHRGSGRRGRRVFRRQDALGDARRLRGAGRLPVEDSTGSVHLQSG